MKRRLILAATALSLAATAELRKDFANPPSDCKPGMIFQWLAEGTSKEGLARDIAAMAEAGFGEAYVVQASMAALPTTARMFSPEWMDTFSHALREAKRNGMKLGFHDCAGWSSSGGPWVRVEDSMKVVVASEKDVPSGAAAGKLPQPLTVRGFYRDIAVKAFVVEPTPSAKSDKTFPATLPLAADKGQGFAITWRFERAFRPTTAILRFLDSNVNTEVTVEGSADERTWTRLGRTDYHFHFAVPKAPKLIALKAAAPVKAVRLVFRANPVPEWQGGKAVDRRLHSVDFSCAPMFADADIKASALNHYGYRPPSDPAEQGVAPGDWLDLTGALGADGTLAWTAPAAAPGKVWRVLRLGYTTTGKECAPAPQGGRGLECDKLSKKALEAFWEGMPAKLLALPDAKGAIVGPYIDSWEVAGQNWTEGFDAEFRRRRGYSLGDWLPIYAGYTVGDALETAKALYDIQRTVAELIAENYYDHFAELCRRAGVKSMWQGYGGPFTELRCAAAADEPQGEFWLDGQEYRASPKMASSVAHLHGKPVASTESFTTEEAPGRFQATPRQLREYGDYWWSMGVNRFMFHSYVHQPFEAKPGCSLGRHGSQMGRNTTWWREMRHLTEYVRRGQLLLRAGEPRADALVYVGEDAPNDYAMPMKALNRGFDFDFCCVDDLLRLENRSGGGVGMPGLRETYSAILVCGKHPTIKTLRKLKALAAGGARLAGRRPFGTCTREDDPAEWKALADELWGGGKILETGDLDDALDRFGVKPCVSGQDGAALRTCRRELPNGGMVYYVYNNTGKPFRGSLKFAAKGRGEVWNCVDGTVTPYGGELSIARNEGAFVVFANDESPVASSVKARPMQAVDISDGWRIVSFEGQNPPPAPMEMPKLADWSKSTDARLRYFSGRAAYERVVARPKCATLDLGDVREIANVHVDGKFVACLWDAPYRVDLTPFLKGNGETFTLRVEVVNTWPNRMIGDAIARKQGAKEDRGECNIPKWVLEGRTDSGTGIYTWSNFGWAWKAGNPLRPAGLLGPVRLEVPEPSAEELVDRAKAAPSLMFRAADLPAIRRRLAEDPDAKAWWEGFRKALDANIAKGVKVPPCGAQWYHWYSCRKCGTHLKGESPTRHVCPKCGEAHSGWPYDDAYWFPFQHQCGYMVRDAGVAWAITGERRYADVAKDLLLDYAKVYLSWPRHDNWSKATDRNPDAARAFSQALDESVWMIDLVRGFDAISGTLTEEERQTIFEKVFKPAADIIYKRDDVGHPILGNHQCWHFSAYALAALVMGDVARVRESIDGLSGWKYQLSRGILEDGCWYEGAWGYQFYTMSSLAPYFTALRNLGYEPPAEFKRLFDSPFGQLSPTWCLPAVNDTGRVKFEPGTKAELYELAWTWWGDPQHGWWVARRPRRTMEYALWGSPAPKDAAFTPPASQNFEASGLAVLRSRSAAAKGLLPDNMLAMDYGPHGGWHGHHDKLQLLLWGRGRMWGEDPGCIAYGNPRHWGWYRSTLAHNTLAMGGRNQAPAQGRLVGYAAGENAAVVAADSGEAYPGATVRRATALVDDIVLDFAEVHADSAHEWEWAFHARGELETSVANGVAVPTAPPEIDVRDRNKVETAQDMDHWLWVEDVREGAHGGAWHSVWRQGGDVLHLFQKSPAGVLRTGTGPAQPPPEKFRLAVNRVTGGRHLAFRTVMTLDGSADVQIGDEIARNGWHGFSATVGGRCFELTVNGENVRLVEKDGTGKAVRDLAAKR